VKRGEIEKLRKEVQERARLRLEPNSRLLTPHDTQDVLREFCPNCGTRMYRAERTLTTAENATIRFIGVDEPVVCWLCARCVSEYVMAKSEGTPPRIFCARKPMA